MVGVHANPGGPVVAATKAELFEQIRRDSWREGYRSGRWRVSRDSPIALAAWMINHDAGSYQDIADAFA